MKCPYCDTPIDEHKASHCLDAWIATVIFGATGWEEPLVQLGAFGPMFPLPYSANIAAAWEVHEVQIEKLFSKRRGYLLALEEELREREKHVVPWPDALIFLSPLAICRAALKTTTHETQTAQT